MHTSPNGALVNNLAIGNFVTFPFFLRKDNMAESFFPGTVGEMLVEFQKEGVQISG
jgi:hypothetical protein